MTLTPEMRRACDLVDEAREHMDAAMLPDGLSPVGLRMAASALRAAAKAAEKARKDGDTDR